MGRLGSPSTEARQRDMCLGYVSLGAAPNAVGKVEEGMQAKAKAFKALRSEIYLNESGATREGGLKESGAVWSPRRSIPRF